MITHGPDDLYLSQTPLIVIISTSIVLADVVRRESLMFITHPMPLLYHLAWILKETIAVRNSIDDLHKIG